jgi:hypothetical protein
MGAAESRDMPLLQKRRFTPDERKELRRNMHYNPDEELASGIEHAAEHKVTKTIPVTICVAQSSLICRTGVSCVPIEDIVFVPYSEANSE